MIRERLRRMAALYPERAAVVDGGETITYRALDARVESFAGRLAELHNVGPGDVVALSLPNCWEFIVGFFAIVEAGAAALPLNTQWRAKEIEWIAGRLPPAAVITNAILRGAWEQVADRLLLVEDPDVRRALQAGSRAERGGARAAAKVFEEEPALYLATSGSTGRPRLVPRSHRNLLAAASNVAGRLNVSPGRRFLCAVPFYHANGFNNCMLLPLLYGAAAVPVRKFTPGAAAETVRREHVHVLNASPFIYGMLAEHCRDAAAFASLDTCLSSGARMPRDLAALCEDRLGLRVGQLYGASETGAIAITTGRAAEPEGSVGRPLETVEVKIIGEGGRDVPAGEAGEIAVRSPAVTKGYVGEPALNGEVFQDGFFRTGDTGSMDARGNLILAGGRKRIINVGGIKVDPAEIERVLMDIPAVQDCRVLAISEHLHTEIVRAVLVLRPGRVLSRGEVVGHCRERLAEYKIPRVIEFADRMPVDLAGKTPLPWSNEEGVGRETRTS